jgi:hypothetical protein
VYIVAIHDIAKPQEFWEAVRVAPIPEGIKLHSTLPNRDATRAVCLWEAGSINDVKNLVENTVGPLSTNEYFEVEPSNALGLPS